MRHIFRLVYVVFPHVLMTIGVLAVTSFMSLEQAGGIVLLVVGAMWAIDNKIEARTKK